MWSRLLWGLLSLEVHQSQQHIMLGLAEVVAESGCGCVVQGEPSALAEAINRLLGDRELRRGKERHSAGRLSSGSSAAGGTSAAASAAASTIRASWSGVSSTALATWSGFPSIPPISVVTFWP